METNEKTKLTETEKVQLKEQAKKMVMDEFNINDHDAELLAVAMEEAKMPVEMTDKDMKLGERELDIRKLSKTNKDQMIFRMQILNIVYQRQLITSLVDVERLLMLVLKKMGVEDIQKETEALLAELAEKLRKETEKAQKA